MEPHIDNHAAHLGATRQAKRRDQRVAEVEARQIDEQRADVATAHEQLEAAIAVAEHRRDRVAVHIERRLATNRAGTAEDRQFVDDRSEEHTSELQSLMRISYA